MSDLTRHLIQSIKRDSDALLASRAISDHNRSIIQAILENPSKDYHAPPLYASVSHGAQGAVGASVRSREHSSSSVSDKPFLPPRPGTVSETSRAFPRQGKIEDSPPQYHKEPARPLVPAKPISNEKLSAQHRVDQAQKEEKKSDFKSRMGNNIANGASHGIGWGIGTGIVGKLL